MTDPSPLSSLLPSVFHLYLSIDYVWLMDLAWTLIKLSAITTQVHLLLGLRSSECSGNFACSQLPLAVLQSNYLEENTGLV